MKAILEPIIAFGVVVGIVLGGIAYFAKAEDLKMVEMRLDQKINADRINQIQNRIWTLEDRNQGRPCSDWRSNDEKAEYRKLKEDLKDLQHKQKLIMERGGR